MKIHGCEFNLERAAHDIALAYAKKSLEDEFTPTRGDIANMMQAYAIAYTQVASMDASQIEALIH